MSRKPNRFHDNLIVGLFNINSSGPLDLYDPVHSPRVYRRPTNIRQIVSLWGRLKAAWLVFTMNAVALKWYDEKNAHTYGDNWHERFAGPNKAIDTPSVVGQFDWPTTSPSQE